MNATPTNTISAVVLSDLALPPKGGKRLISSGSKGQEHFSDSVLSLSRPVASYKLKPFLLSCGEQALTQLISDLPTEFLFVDPRTFQPSPYWRSRATPKDLDAIETEWRRTIQKEAHRCQHLEPAE